VCDGTSRVRQPFESPCLELDASRWTGAQAGETGGVENASSVPGPAAPTVLATRGNRIYKPLQGKPRTDSLPVR